MLSRAPVTSLQSCPHSCGGSNVIAAFDIFLFHTTCREFGVESLGVKGDGRVVPVVLLQFTQERAVLIDNAHQALSQPVAILAVQVRASGVRMAVRCVGVTCFQSPHGFLPSPLSCSGAVPFRALILNYIDVMFGWQARCSPSTRAMPLGRSLQRC